MKLALDAGSESDLGPIVEGALSAAKSDGLEILLVGPSAALKIECARLGLSQDARFEIVDAPAAPAPESDPAAALRSKPGCSTMRACELVLEGRAAGLVSAASPGVAMAAALWHLKRLPGVLRPAMAAPLATPAGVSVLVDAGTNQDCKPWHLLQFGVMGAVFALHILKRANPRLGLLSGDHDDARGSELVRETVPLLKCSGLRFTGLLGGRELLAGNAEVIVCDGFLGDVALELIEAARAAARTTIENEASSGFLGKTRARWLGAPLERASRSASPRVGAPLLGVNGNVVVIRGERSAIAIADALRTAKMMAEAALIDLMRKSVDEIKQNLETSKVNI